MSRDLFLEQLKKALGEIAGPGRVIETFQECPTSDLVLRTACYIAFFAVIERPELVVDVYQRAQAEIARVRSTQGAEWPRDLNLVLLILSAAYPDFGSIRQILDDRYACRKFVLSLNGREIRDVLADLPFGPPSSLLTPAPAWVTASVEEAVRGFDPRLIGDLASHSPGVERVFEKIREGKYSLSPEPSGSSVAPPPKAVPSAWTKLEALEITDFRGIRRLRSEDMPLSGDAIFIYGPNGVGKTSVSDAVEWAITGQVDRLQLALPGSPKSGPDPIVNLFSEKNETQVTCHFSNREPVCRVKHHGSTERRIGSRLVEDRAVIDHVVGTKAPSPEARLRIERLRDLFRGSHILSQHNIRQFLERTEPTDRFDILTNMVGAEEFVRFRGKVSAVLRHLGSYIGSVGEQGKSLKRELEDTSRRLHERQKELQRLSHAVTSGKTPEVLVAELLQGLEKSGSPIDEAAIAGTNAEPEEARLELIAIRADTMIRGKKSETENLLVRLKSLEKELPGYVESRALCDRLAAEITSARKLSEKGRVDLQTQEKARQAIQISLQGLKSRQSEAARRYANLNWLKEKLPAYRQGQDALRRTEDSLAGQREGLRRAEAALEDQQGSLSAKRTRLQEIEQKIAIRTTRDRHLVQLLKRVSDIQGRQQEAERLSGAEKHLELALGELKRQATSARAEANAARGRLDKLQTAYNSEAARYDLLTSFLAKLSELVDSAECPLCGRGFATTEEAKDNIRAHLSVVPIQLKDLAGRLNEAKENASVKQVQADSNAAGIRASEAELEEIRSSRAVVRNAVQDFLIACADLGVSISPEDTASWGNALEQARKECNVTLLGAEAAILRDAIRSLASRAVEQQTAVDALRRRLVNTEKEHTRLAAAVQDLEADMVERGIELGSLPPDNRLAVELAKAQDEARECGEAVGKGEAELQVVDSATAELRENVRMADEDAAIKDAQLRQYNATCSHFLAECQAASVDPEDPKKGIGVVGQRALELNRSLHDLEEKRRVLQEVVSLERLRSEVAALSDAEGSVKRRVEASSREGSRLREWESHIENLEAEVSRQQLDVVGSHLERLEPTTQQLYRRLSPHPIFGKVRIRVHERTRELDIEAEASVPPERLGDIAVSPSAFFSDAQMNSLAITVFLGGALRQQWSGFKTILIDDPVQQMDEMNVFAFLDLIRGLSDHRQFIIFTCSRDFYLLALEKLDCLNKSKRGSFMAYRLEGVAPATLKVHCDAP